MNRALKLAAVGTAAAAMTLTACTVDEHDDDRDRCRTVAPIVMFFSSADRHYHYGSPTGKVVPAHKVPASARKVPGYKPPAAPKPPKSDVNKTPKDSGKQPSKPDLNKQPPAAKPQPAPRPAPAPAPRVGGRR